MYVDDARDNLEAGAINGMQSGGKISIDFSRPQVWEKQLEFLQAKLKSSDGVILDLKLNEKPIDEHGSFAKFRGSSVAQELRTLAKESPGTKDFPIILISAENKLADSLDQTSLDLFDYIIKKGDMGQKQGFSFDDIIARLSWLVEGYNFLSAAKKSAKETLGITDTEILDIRFLEEWNRQLGRPIHVMARFLIKKVIDRPSFLIDENLLSARLGISRSSGDWNKVLENLKDAKYAGAFSKGIDRWWMPLIEVWWDDISKGKVQLRSLSAEQRVKYISDALTLTKLEPLKKMETAKSSAFWVVCKGRGTAIDTTDGLIISGQEHIYPWQGLEYISIEEALLQTNNEAWTSVAAIEKDRLKRFQELYTKAQRRVKK